MLVDQGADNNGPGAHLWAAGITMPLIAYHQGRYMGGAQRIHKQEILLDKISFLMHNLHFFLNSLIQVRRISRGFLFGD